MGRLITPLSAPNAALAAAATDSAAERILKYIPAEVVAFYIAALGVIDSVPEENPAKNWAYLGVFVLGLLAAPAYICVLAKPEQPKCLMMAWSTLAFLVWAYTLGGLFKLVEDLHQPWIGSILLGAVTLIAGLLPIPRQD